MEVIIRVTCAQVVKKSVTAADNSPFQDYSHPYDQILLPHSNHLPQALDHILDCNVLCTCACMYMCFVGTFVYLALFVETKFLQIKKTDISSVK